MQVVGKIDEIWVYKCLNRYLHEVVLRDNASRALVKNYPTMTVHKCQGDDSSEYRFTMACNDFSVQAVVDGGNDLMILDDDGNVLEIIKYEAYSEAVPWTTPLPRRKNRRSRE